MPSASGVAAGAPRGRPRCVLNLRALQGRSADGAADGAATAESYADLVRRMRVEAGDGCVGKAPGEAPFFFFSSPSMFIP